MDNFYNTLTPFYHLIFQDWEASMKRQGMQLSRIIQSEWPRAKNVLDVSCGIGTQAIALAANGYSVTGSDLSGEAVVRAVEESSKRGLDIPFSVCDMRDAHAHHGAAFDLVISADNSIPHLLSDEEIKQALAQMYACLTKGGGCLITIRDYEALERGTNLVKPYGVRVEAGRRYLIFQVWDFEEDIYELTFFFIEEDLATRDTVTHTMRTRYYAISIDKLCDLMRLVGFQGVRRLDNVFYQPVLIGTRPE